MTTLDPDSLTFDAAIAHLNGSGWYLHQLWQDGHIWGCTIREYGPGRRQIANGKGLTAILAIFTALAAAPEDEPKVVIVNAIIGDKVDVSHLSFAKQPTFNRRF
jgi:hypothetical protein